MTTYLKSLIRLLVAKYIRSTAWESENTSKKDKDNKEDNIKEESKE